ncbi:hypothetical protein LY76DRAFT_587294 [Colletotrichum caudatum]|nr:hypothetical protein LY76DRAFT_587294 [Colletotrichum caudatum]
MALMADVLSNMQTSLYGKCIVADYNAVHKDKCSKEFLRLKDCYLVSPPSSCISQLTWS